MDKKVEIMTSDVEKAVLKFYGIERGKWFEADLAGISQLKREVHRNADEFLLLRKGEDWGAVIEMLFELMAQSPETIEFVFSHYFEHFPEVASSVNLNKLLEMDWVQILAFYKVITNGKELIIKTWEIMENILDPGRNKGSLPELRILCNSDEVNEKARIGWEDMGFKVRNYKDPAKAGSHRFYLTEKEYCIFIRKPDSTFFGFRGSDKDVISNLKSQFCLEWDINVPE